MRKFLLLQTLLMVVLMASAGERKKLNFNADWRLEVGDFSEASKPDFDDASWKHVTLPFAFHVRADGG